jgi:hypothetical protein
MARHGLGDINLLVCDAEGHDFEILTSSFKDDIEPDVVFFEVVHMSRGERNTLRSLLQQRGYSYVEDLKDCLAVKAHLLRECRRRE